MTHLMQWQVWVQQPAALRTAAATVLRMLSVALYRLALRVEQRQLARAAQPRADDGTAEYQMIELGGRMVGAYYIDGELVAVVPDVMRL